MIVHVANKLIMRLKVIMRSANTAPSKIEYNNHPKNEKEEKY